MLEILVVAALIGIIAAIATPLAAKLIRRSEDMAALATARQALGVARLEAVKTGANVIVVISKDPNNVIRLLSFRDKASRCAGGVNAGNPCTQDGDCPGSTCRLDISSPNDGNGVQDPGEPTLENVALSARIHFWKQGGSVDDDAGAVLFDNCVGDATRRCIAFVPGGGIRPPSSGPATPTTGRGIYFADWAGKNYFRVTVESDLSGKARVDKYVDEASGYYPPSPATKWHWL